MTGRSDLLESAISKEEKKQKKKDEEKDGKRRPTTATIMKTTANTFRTSFSHAGNNAFWKNISNPQIIISSTIFYQKYMGEFSVWSSLLRVGVGVGRGRVGWVFAVWLPLDINIKLKRSPAGRIPQLLILNHHYNDNAPPQTGFRDEMART